MPRGGSAGLALLRAALLLAACVTCRGECVFEVTQAMLNECMTETAGARVCRDFADGTLGTCATGNGGGPEPDLHQPQNAKGTALDGFGCHPATCSARRRRRVLSRRFLHAGMAGSCSTACKSKLDSVTITQGCSDSLQNGNPAWWAAGARPWLRAACRAPCLEHEHALCMHGRSKRG